ncbi:uncharacterized protein [Parasteatoda tepidariorum]|uniref:uncharacterized protein n=1 Tax=Parasteatoda tepidariorum TaxID=114398 RepID=UPI001C7256E7|nr:uncharacterized protein LOC107449154 [Parasteatoda tepidariorum]
MEYTIKKYEGNKVFNDSSDLFELFCCMIKHQCLKIPPYVSEHHLLSWTWNKSEINNASPVIKKIKLLEDLCHYKFDKALSINDEIVFNSNAINILHSGYYSRHGIVIPFNILSILSSFTKLKRHFVEKPNLTPKQEFIILLPSCDVEYASKFYSFRKIDSFFNYFHFKGSRIEVQPELFLGFEDISRESCSQKTKESNFIFASSPTSKLPFTDKEKCPDSIWNDFIETDFASKRSNSSEKIQMSCLLKSNFKFHSVKSRDYLMDLMKNYKHLYFPMKRCVNAVRKQRTSTNRLYNVFTKNRQFSKNVLYRNYQCSKRYYFAKDATPTIANDCLSVDTENGDKPCSSLQENFIDQEISGKHIKSKIAEIRQKIENLSRGVNCELIRRERHHLTFIEQCKRISDSTISSHDYNEIYHTESLQNKVKVSCSDDISDFNLSDLHENANSCYEVIRRSKTLNSTSEVPKKNQTSIPHSQVFNHRKVNSRDHVQHQSAALNSHKHILKQNGVLRQKNISYLGNCFRNFRHQTVVALSTISVPFVALLFR